MNEEQLRDQIHQLWCYIDDLELEVLSLKNENYAQEKLIEELSK